MIIKRLHKGYKNPAFFATKLLVKVKVMDKVIKNEWLGAVQKSANDMNQLKAHPKHLTTEALNKLADKVKGLDL
jgi:hypothetical protein